MTITAAAILSALSARGPVDARTVDPQTRAELVARAFAEVVAGRLVATDDGRRWLQTVAMRGVA